MMPRVTSVLVVGLLMSYQLTMDQKVDCTCYMEKAIKREYSIVSHSPVQQTDRSSHGHDLPRRANANASRYKENTRSFNVIALMFQAHCSSHLTTYLCKYLQLGQYFRNLIISRSGRRFLLNERDWIK